MKGIARATIVLFYCTQTFTDLKGLYAAGAALWNLSRKLGRIEKNYPYRQGMILNGLYQRWHPPRHCILSAALSKVQASFTLPSLAR